MKSTLIGAFLIVTFLFTPNLVAQDIPATPLVFDVVTIRLMPLDDTTPSRITNSPRNGNFKAVHVNLKGLLEVAYDMPDIRMFGGPKWVDTLNFYVEAKASPELEAYIASHSPEEGRQIKREMVTALLADRFHLTVHKESHEMPIYAMIVGRDGPRLTGATQDTVSPLDAGDEIAIKSGNDSLHILAYELSWRLERPVVDETGLQWTGKLTLSWNDSAGPSVWTAIQEQLGLKLEPTKGAVPVLLIDSADMPPPN